ncbi:MAG: PQQ-dependent sugar dehydrogenase, partial [Saprospiraceae bacterium]|nr:PQQ-dependent sugar dehydrogenase [Saprospiraceae bacterium]
MKNITLLFCLLFSFGLFAQPKIQLDVYATGFTKPVDITHAGDNRLFIVEQDGAIWILDSNGVKLTTPFLNINPRVRSTGNEQGLLGLAFHPNYADNGYFYVNYSRETDGDTRVSRFSRSASDPNVADPDSELILFTQDQPYSNHNGGCIKFGPDGYLYIGLGDGGSGGDPQGYGQNKNTFLGKMLRIDVDNTQGGLNYAVPADNPFVNDPAYKPEIWSLGLRNPWRFAFDRLTGDMWIGDVGQNNREEVDFEPAGAGGRNYGWRCYEGNASHNTSGCQPASEYVFPVFDYDNNSLGCSITGGMIYRGSKYSDLYGYYLFADYCSGRWWATKQNDDGTFSTQLLANLTDYQYTTFGEDIHGELYVSEHSSGRIMAVREICSGFQVSVDTVWNVTCDSTFSGLIDLEVTGGASPIDISWSIAQQGELVVYLLAGTYTYTAVDNNGCERTGSAEVLFTGVAAPEVTLVSGNAALCPGQTVSLGVAPAPINHTVEWFRDGVLVPGVFGETLVVDQPAVVSARYVSLDGLNCATLRSNHFTIAAAPNPIPSIFVFGGPILCGLPDTIGLGVAEAPAGFGYQWFYNNELLPLET